MSTTTPTVTISSDIARRFLLGRQGLWPGRRWHGRTGTLGAVRDLGSVQMDPLTVVARSHDLVLWNCVAGYRPEMLQHHLYVDRAFFDYGGVLRIQPVEKLPHWRLHMAVAVMTRSITPHSSATIRTCSMPCAQSSSGKLRSQAGRSRSWSKQGCLPRGRDRRPERAVTAASLSSTRWPTNCG